MTNKRFGKYVKRLLLEVFCCKKFDGRYIASRDMSEDRKLAVAVTTAMTDA